MQEGSASYMIVGHEFEMGGMPHCLKVSLTHVEGNLWRMRRIPDTEEADGTISMVGTTHQMLCHVAFRVRGWRNTRVMATDNPYYDVTVTDGDFAGFVRHLDHLLLVEMEKMIAPPLTSSRRR